MNAAEPLLAFDVRIDVEESQTSGRSPLLVASASMVATSGWEYSLVVTPSTHETLAIFLLAVLASGIAVLWNATESPTALLLSVAVAGFVLVNAVIRNADHEVSANRVLRWAALVLAAAIFLQLSPKDGKRVVSREHDIEH